MALNVHVLVVAGGAGGGSGGGGAGEVVDNTAFDVTGLSPITVTVGPGGNGGGFGAGTTTAGSNSAFGSLTALGGGIGGYTASSGAGGNGGSGGGGSWYDQVDNGTTAGGTATGGALGHAGGTGGGAAGLRAGGGGGGAGGVGVAHNTGTAVAGAGGPGYASSISGASVTYAGGGGGGGATGGAGGTGGGGAGETGSGGATAGTLNTGSGGGGGWTNNGAAGGSGTVVVSYPTGTLIGSGGTITTSGGNTIHTFNSSGTWSYTLPVAGPGLWAQLSPVQRLRLISTTRSTVLPAPAAPATPAVPAPADTTVNYTGMLAWVSAGQATADIYLGLTNTPPLVVPNFVGFAYTPTLLPSTTYYWKIVAKNGGGSATGPVWSFTTLAASAVIVTLAGAVATSRVLDGSLTLTDPQGGAPVIGSATFKDTAPSATQAIQIGLGNLLPANLLYAGQLQSLSRTYLGATLPRWPATLIDRSAAFNRRRPFGTWVNTSVSTIVRSVVPSYAPGFTTFGVQDNLPAISVVLDGSLDMTSMLAQFATAIGGYQYLDSGLNDVHLFQTETVNAPDPLDGAHASLLNDPPLVYTVDYAQIRTRVFVKGAGVTVLAACAVGELIIPVSDATIWNAAGGGSAISGSAILTYTGLQLPVGGSLVGPGVAPSSAPSVALLPGLGVDIGQHNYAYVFVTAAGKTLPSPVGSVTTGPVSPPPVAPVAICPGQFDSQINDGITQGDSYTYVATYSYASSSTDYTYITGVSPVSATVSPVALTNWPGHTGALFFTIHASANPLVKWVHVWRSHNGGTYRLCSALQNGVSFGGYDHVTDAAIASAQAAPAAGSTVAQVAVSGIAIGPTGTTSRELHRTPLGSTQLQLLHTIADNTTTTYTDTSADATLGANAPTSDTSALTQPVGQVNAGAVSVLTAGASSFQPNGGWAGAGAVVFRYTGIAGNTLTGVPSAGPGSIAVTIPYGTQILPLPALTGVNANNGISAAILKGAALNLWVQRDSLANQAALGALELDANGNPTDGIHEYPINDSSLISVAMCNARGDADLILFSTPVLTLTYDTRDPKTRAGKTVHAALPAPMSLTGDFVIQNVIITFEGPALMPRYSVTASSVKFTLNDLLRRMALQV